MSQKRQPKGIPVGGEFAANEHDEANLSLVAPGEVTVPADLVKNADHIGETFQDAVTDSRFHAVSAHVLGVPSTYYFDNDSRIIGRVEHGSRGDRSYVGSRVKGGESVRSQWEISDHASYGAIRRLPGGEKRPGFVGADAGMMHAQEELRAGLFSDRAADSALIIGVMEGHLSRGVPGKDAYAELQAWGYAAQSNPEFYDGMEDTITELYGGIPREDIPKKRPKIAALVRWEDSVSSTGTISASRRRGRMVAAAVLSGQSKWWNLRDRAKEIVEE
jgi:hypothetical protein